MSLTPEEIWKALSDEVAGQAFQGLIIRRIYPESDRDLFLGIQQPGEHRLLVLQVDRSLLPSSGALPEAQGVEVRLGTLPGAPPDRGAILLILRDARFGDLFQVLVSDLTAALVSAETDNGAVAVFLHRLTKWQKFLEVIRGEGLGEAAQRGLYGELVFLRDHLIARSGPEAIRSWNGFRRTPQDFYFASGAVEVKTGIAGNHNTVMIHGLRQLDETLVPRLLLCRVILVETAPGETLYDIVATLRDQIGNGGDLRASFEMALLEAGYSDRHAGQYRASKFTVQGVELYEVNSEFPRLRSCDIREGLRDATYSVDIGCCGDYRVPIQILQELVTG